MTNMYIGPVASQDANNQSNSAGANAFGSLTDWFNFVTPYRTWGVDSASIMNLAAEGACSATNASCRIDDWRYNSADAVAHNALTSPLVTPTTQTHTFSDGHTATFLLSAVEVLADGIGNDNGLCESGETCIVTPNIGAYQGTGALTVAGTVSGSTLLVYSAN